MIRFHPGYLHIKMKKSLLGHGLWAVVAVGAFVLGSQGISERGEGPDGNVEGPGSKSGRAGAGMEEDGVEGGARRGSRIRERREGGEMIVLTDAQIEALGRQFRESNNPIERRLAFGHLLEGLTAENALLMREQIAHLDDDSAEFREFHYAWGAIAGGPAVVHGANTPKQDMAASLAGWASADPQAALAWFESVDIANDPKLSALGGDGDRNVDGVRANLLIGMVFGLSDHDPYAAAAYVSGLAAEGNGKATWMMGMIADKVLKADGPEGASTWAANLPAGPARAGALTKVAEIYAREDPVSAVAWLESIPATEDTSQSYRRTFSTWAGEDPVEAGEYLGQMVPSADRDAAISGYAPRVAREDFAAAIDWANAVADPGMQQRAVIQSAQIYYHRVDKEAATEWLANSGLSAEAQQEVMHPRRR